MTVFRYPVLPRGRTGMPCSWANFFSAAVVQPASVAMSARVRCQVRYCVQPVQVDASRVGVRGGLLAVGVEAPPDRAQRHGQRVVAQDLARVAG